MAEPMSYYDDDYFAAITAQSYTLDFQASPSPNSFPFIDHNSPILDGNQNHGIISFENFNMMIMKLMYLNFLNLPIMRMVKVQITISLRRLTVYNIT